MAMYEFLCKCGVVYEELVKYDESGKYLDVLCPICQSNKHSKLMSKPAEAVFTNPEGTRKYISGSGGHDYRFKSKQPKIAEQRKVVEQVSHVGPAPYNVINDVDSGDHFGDVK
jgi:hypothetical protein